jgi:hypothetical protein
MTDQDRILAQAKATNPEFWEAWNMCRDRWKMKWDYEAAILELDAARESLGLPEHTPLPELPRGE